MKTAYAALLASAPHVAIGFYKNGLNDPLDVYWLLGCVTALSLSVVALVVQRGRPAAQQASALPLVVLITSALLLPLWGTSGFETLQVAGLVLASLAWLGVELTGTAQDTRRQLRDLVLLFTEDEHERRARLGRLRQKTGPVQLSALILATWGIQELLTWARAQSTGTSVELVDAVDWQQPAGPLVQGVLGAAERRRLLPALLAALTEDPDAASFRGRIRWRDQTF